MMQIQKHINRVLNSITYIIKDTDSDSCWLIDIGDYDEIIRIVDGGIVEGIFLTHTHYDHIYGLNKFLEYYPKTTIFTNKFGMDYLSSPSDNLSLYHNDLFVINNRANIVCLEEGDYQFLGKEVLYVIETPGHDKSCLTYVLGSRIFTGDSFIPGIKVFSKLQNGNFADATNSEKRIISECEGKIIYPGHYI